MMGSHERCLEVCLPPLEAEHLRVAGPKQFLSRLTRPLLVGKLTQRSRGPLGSPLGLTPHSHLGLHCGHLTGSRRTRRSRARLRSNSKKTLSGMREVRGDEFRQTGRTYRRLRSQSRTKFATTRQTHCHKLHSSGRRQRGGRNKR